MPAMPITYETDIYVLCVDLIPTPTLLGNILYIREKFAPYTNRQASMT